MAQKKVIARLETYVIVTVITVLVWLYAEGKNVGKETARVVVEFVAPHGQEMIVRLESEETNGSQRSSSKPSQIAEVTFECASSRIEAVRNELQSKPIQITVGQNVADGRVQQKEVKLLDWFKEHNDIAGVTILSVLLNEKPRVMVTLDPFIEVKIPIWVTSSDVDLAAPLDWEPKEAVLSMPVGLAESVMKREVILSRQLDKAFFGDFQVNIEQADIPVELTIPPDLKNEYVKNRPRTVKVTFTIRKQSETWIYKRLPIKIVLPVAALASFVKIETESEILPEVPLSGPSHVISDIREGKIKIMANVTLSSQDLNEGKITKTLEFFVPPGVTVDEQLVGMSINLKITRQTSSPSTELDTTGPNP